MDAPETEGDRPKSEALVLLSSERPRNLSWPHAGALLFGDWGTSRLYVLGLAFLVAGRSSFWLICAMSLLILAVGWAYTQICRIYSDGGGVYTAGRHRSPVIGVIGALLLFADYTVTASLSAVEAFHYFGFGETRHVQHDAADPGDDIRRQGPNTAVAKPLVTRGETLWQTLHRSPGLCAILAIVLVGILNLLGPKHTAGYAMFAAVGMMLITFLIVVFALPQIEWSKVEWGQLFQAPGDMWYGFVYIVLALSGVEAIANLTGVMRKPVTTTARKSIWLVAGEVAVFNVLLVIVMIALSPGRDAHTEDMLAYMAGHYIGAWGEWPVRIVGGLLLLSATNTAVNGLMSIIYVMSRDGEMPRVFQKLNSFGSPWVAALVATGAPAIVLLVYHDLASLAAMYAIGVVGAVAINTSLTTFHPRLRRPWRKLAMGSLAVLLIAIELTLAFTKLHALVFVTIVLVAGLSLRLAARAARRRPKMSLLRQAIIAQLPPVAMAKPKLLLATAGSTQLAHRALELASKENAALVVAFVRDVSLSYKVEAETRLTLDTDPAAQALFADFLDLGHRYNVPIIPMYDTGPNATELLAETAAMMGVHKVVIGSSRRGALHQLIRGSFQRKLEGLLPPDVRVHVVSLSEAAAAAEESSPTPPEHST